MQDTEWVNAHLTELLAIGQEPLMKLEIEVGVDNWIDLCALDTKNYVEGINVSLGGAGMTPNPIGGTIKAMLSNEDSIFHPKHPSSGYEEHLKTGRKVRISIGAKYNDTDYYWQRVIGFIDEPRFKASNQKISVSGGDYMKLLQDTELKSPDNYWGTYATFDSIPSDGKLGSELYNEADAMDIDGEADNVTNWLPASNCTFVSVANGQDGSNYYGKVTNTQMENSYIRNTNVINGDATTGKKYKITFKYRRVSGSACPMTASIYQGAPPIGSKGGLASSDWETITFYATAVADAPLIMEFKFGDTNQEFQIDLISIWEFKPYWERYYQLPPETSKGPYRVLLKQNSTWEDVWQGEEDEGWFHEENTKRVFFDINKEVVAGTDNLKIYYFTAEVPENVVADILVKCGLYANRTEALDTMEYTPTEILIDKIWFEPGSTCLNAIKKLCERGGANGIAYRFHFKWNGIPVFKPKPAPETTAFTFTDQKHIASFSNYQDRNEIRNRIVIEGMKQAEPVNKEETMPPELKGEAADDTEGASIDTYGERTLTIKNHLFQDQDSINDMCATLLAEYKDPKWYSDVEVPFNPVPLELGDKMGWKERLSAVLEVAQTGVIRDIKIDNFNTTYKCEVD